MPEVPQWILTIAGSVGSATAAYFAARAKHTANRSEQNTKHIQDEIEGPGDQPSLRQMITTSHEFTINYLQGVTGQMESLHGDYDTISRRMTSLEENLKAHTEEDNRMYQATLGAHIEMSTKLIARMERIETLLSSKLGDGTKGTQTE